MKIISGYEILETVGETAKSIVYRGIEQKSGQKVVIKVLKSVYPTKDELARFRYEYSLVKDIDLKGVVAMYDIIRYRDSYALVLEDFNGISLKDYTGGKKLSLKDFFIVAGDIAVSLNQLHNRNIIHKDIKPSNILVTTDLSVVKITDLGIATINAHLNEEIYNPNIIEGTLVYMSPEQTGRMNRQVDYRTDIYSLGITFFQLLTGILPFRSKDPLEIIYSHIALEPPEIITLNGSICNNLNSLIARMLAKNPEDRYQSAGGLLHDLKQLESAFKSGIPIEDFVPGSHDIPFKFTIPHIVVGREKEIEVISHAYRRVLDGEKYTVFVHGPGGIGKTTVINELQKNITAAKGYFISAKYNQLDTNPPYYSLIEAFAGAIRLILSEGDARIAQWKERIVNALGRNGKIMTAIIPKLELVIGKQPDVPVLTGEAERNRFIHVFKQFIGSLAGPDTPLVLFIDDLQWADYAGLSMIQNIVTDPGIVNFLFIGAYRESWIKPGHHLLTTLDGIRTCDIQIHDIPLGPLNENETNQLVAAFLRCSLDKSQDLSGLIHQKTMGNPFFINQFMKNMYEKELFYPKDNAPWEWDISKIKEMDITDNVVQLLSEKVLQLQERTRNILKICSCIGNRFDLEILEAVTQEAVEDLFCDIDILLEENLISSRGYLYVFSHDRVQEAVYGLVSEDEKQKIHYSIGNEALRNHNPHSDGDQMFFFITDHLNAAINYIKTEEEEDRLLHFNLESAVKAKSSAAFSVAYNYIKQAIRLLSDTCMEDKYETAFKVYLEAAEIACLNLDYDALEIYGDIIEKAGRTVIEKIKVYKIKIRAYTARNELGKAIEMGLKGLRQIGFRLPAKPRMIYLVCKLLKTDFMLWGKRIESLADLPDMTDPRMLVVMDLFIYMAGPAYMSNPELFFLITLYQIQLSLKYGNGPGSPLSYGGYGIILCGILKRYDKGYEFGKLALKTAEKFDDPEALGAIMVMFFAFIAPWKKRVYESIQPLYESYRLSVENGNHEYAAYGIFMYISYQFITCSTLSEYEQEIAKVATYILPELKQSNVENWTRMFWQMMHNLMGNSEDPCVLTGEFYDEERDLQSRLVSNDRSGIASFYNFKANLYFKFEEYDKAIEYLKKLEEYIDAFQATLAISQYYCLESLIYFAAFDTLPPREQKRVLKLGQANAKKLKAWANFGPDNHTHEYSLIEAEIARVTGDGTRALMMYKAAIDHTRENHFIEDEAVARECFAKFYMALDHHEEAALYMTGAYELYRLWGADAKAEFMKNKYSGYINRTESRRDLLDSSSVSASAAIDLRVLRRSLIIIAAEKIYSKMVENTMQTVMEFAGARKGFLVIRKNTIEEEDALYVEAQMSVESEEVSILQSIPVDECDGLSLTAVNYVKRTMDRLVIHNARIVNPLVPRLISDDYVQNNDVKSILCVPLIGDLEGEIELVGLIYLENNLTYNAFTDDSIEILEIICLSVAGRLDLARKAVTDGLTGLYNHTYFQLILDQQIEIIGRKKYELALIMIDIDHFKSFNDTWGHQAGDLVLFHVAGQVKKSVRRSDIVVRYGGEEMAVVLPETSMAQGLFFAEQIRRNIEEMTVDFETHSLKVTASFGVSIFETEDTKANFIKRADTALYKSKKNGRNRVSF